MAFKFYSESGLGLVRNILLGVLPNFQPHHYQMDGICKVLDGVDLVAVTPTGSGKTAYLFLTILVMMAISKTPSLCPHIKFPKDPAIIVVCPTNSIEQQMGMQKLGVPALTINSETVSAARIRHEDIWLKARSGISMLILGPEQLISKGFRDLLAFEPFYDRVCALGVDEIHLLVNWGMSFRKAFQQIGFMRARLRPGIPIIGLTASMVADIQAQNAIFELLGVNRGEFHLIRRSNARHDIQFLFRQLHSGIDGNVFPEIVWVLDNTDKTLIFGTTISLVHRLKAYLNSLSRQSDRDFRIRTYTGLNWADDKLQTLEDITNDPRCQIIIATNCLAQGNDIKVIKTVIQIGEPENIEMYVQKPGRARPCVQNPRAIFYISRTRMDLAAKIIRQTDAENDADAKKAGTSIPRMSRAVAEILTAACKPMEQNRQFDNPDTDSPCPCQTCTASPPATRPEHCTCSGCQKETATRELYVPPPKGKKKANTDIPPAKKLTKVMKEAGRARLEEFRVSVWLEASDRTHGLTPLSEFLPDTIITLLLDRFLAIQTQQDLVPLIGKVAGLNGYHEALFEVLVGLRETLKKLKKTAKKK
ncbi:ATP-dependent DNA helicase Q1 [Favolaschia claudopus]|uniref:DNA 3'-5' helicase n=1 Tax=Favolaschia claudopus TaxID=2862362 RepID=A0AAV9Z7I0_9AGAR